MLIIRDLVKVYPGGVTALHGVSLEIPHGMFGLLGPNGAGKSSLMRILAGVLEATSGTVALDDLDVLKRPDRLWPQLGFLPQEFGFYPHLTGAAMLDFLLKMKGVESYLTRKELTSELLARVNLTGAAHQRVKEYSGGMRQRLGIAQAIAGNPRLLIVDEPTAGLDPEERQRFYRILTELAADRTVLLSTHIVEDVAVLCPRFAIIRQGRVVAQTTPQDARAMVNGMVFAGRVEAAWMDEFRRQFLVLQETVVEGVYHVRVLAALGAGPAGFPPSPPTLEDAYLALISGRLAPPPPIAPIVPPAATAASAPAPPASREEAL
ncbi:multidrug ABC transporter ATP-binding protein [Capsulimonas corticalis]|uniref:Multidrug ABC transporter ATP-binding protein n=1 Tax=Capsulimonas corticalis TaxID=2219043 RepID=A0A402CVC6_9BACT|nr:ATP-binding cassette domain-containing protein [Capsulimonas corticalis]BDI30353.1 multidrug ABC transporter ATP-binding protein [Capsulimonas corticalis]